MRPLLLPSIVLAAVALVAPAEAEPQAGPDSSSDASTSPGDGAPGAVLLAHREPIAHRYGLVDDGAAAIALGTAAFRLQANAQMENGALYGDIHPSCAIMSCEGDARSHLLSWDDLKFASTSLAFAAVGIGATWLVTVPGKRIGVSSLEIKVTTGPTTGLTVIGRF